MRLLLSILGPLLLAPALSGAATPRDWSTVAVKTPSGAILVGNPRAKVKLVEYASYTCPHCAHFSAESGPVLKDRMIRSGSTSLEFRHVVFNGLDLGAAVLVRCAGPGRFAATSAVVYATQGQWLPRGEQFQQANGRRIAMYPAAAQMRAMVDGSGLTGMMVARGLTPAAIDACFADTAEIDRITAMAGDVTSTPTFVLNGKRVPLTGWAGLEPQLRAAGAR